MSDQGRVQGLRTAEQFVTVKYQHNELQPLDINEYLFVNSEYIEKEEDRLLSVMGAVQRKRQGVFFTPHQLAKLAVSKIDILPKQNVFDPACGTGNLLVEVASGFEVKETLVGCLADWNERLYGLDINPDFIKLAKKKIISLALSKGAIPSGGVDLVEAMSMLSNIKVGDFLIEYNNYVGLIDNVVMNPPFCPIDTPSEVKWTSGKSNAAALFMAYALDVMPVGGAILGILPDVLKSGSRYEAWRHKVFNPIRPNIDEFGSFEKDVQVDVFVLSGIKRPETTLGEYVAAESAEERVDLLADKFTVSVGPVVPHRDPLAGIDAPFAHAKILPAWSTVTLLAERIMHPGRKIKCPFIAVRRTSSPKDKYRVVGTIVDCDEAVAVENHIISVCPKDGTMEACVSLLKLFKTSAVNDYINSRIKCRHLTVGVIKDLPIGEWYEQKE